MKRRARKVRRTSIEKVRAKIEAKSFLSPAVVSLRRQGRNDAKPGDSKLDLQLLKKSKVLEAPVVFYSGKIAVVAMEGRWGSDHKGQTDYPGPTDVKDPSH